MTRVFQYITVILAAASLAACKVGKDFQRPEVALPAQFGSTTATADSSIANAQWRQFFPDQALQNLITEALKSTFDLQVALKRIDAASSYLKQAKAQLLPSLTANATGNTTIPSKNSLNGVSLNEFLKTSHIEDFSLNVGLTWEIDIWGKIRRQKESALATYLQSFEAAKAVQTGIIANVANSYFNLLMLDAQLQIARKNVFLSDTIVQMIKMQKTAGEVTELAVQQAVAQKQNAELLIPQLEQAAAIQENAIRILMGQMPGSVTRGGTLDAYPIWDSLQTGIPAQVIANRPDVKASELGLKAANANVGAAQGAMYPALSLTANGGLNAYEIGKWFSMPNSLFGTVAGSIAQPIFQQRRLKTNVEVAKVERDQAVIRFRQSVTVAVQEVSNALIQLDKLQGQQDIAGARLQTTQQAVSNARLLFRSGLANYLEVISAQGSSLQAELTQVDIRRQRLTAMVDLYRSLGGGFQ
ncbi:efflux transporter outer membrane subunit [Chitinophaga barathri]|uniref:Efflux transporter outer membrane subunit n=1 Tax=Chitinophaga barathri TaxID=1647451 RepID=A0A3N4MCP4_9BACT|nr:efflux transporter outer membrane subunit [Chitinophaga barathri]RPD39297.1 efflux transporter outer membrane subunit [Chitinophaga barathri]